jgi:hypothetical protein
MTRNPTPIRRSIGFSGVLLFLIVIAAVVAIVGVFSEGEHALAIAGLVFLLVAGGAAVWVRQNR